MHNARTRRVSKWVGIGGLLLAAAACGDEEQRAGSEAAGGGSAEGGGSVVASVGGSDVGGSGSGEGGGANVGGSGGSAGGAGGAGGGGGAGAGWSADVTAVYPAAAAWNDYVEADGTGPHDASGTACDPEAAHAGYWTCIHAAEMRAVEIGSSSCDGLTATDHLGAFEWTCDDTTNPSRILSLGLKRDARLADLIDFDALAWLPNGVTISKEGSEVHTTDDSVWFDNSIFLANQGGLLIDEGAVYVVTQDPNLNLIIDRDRVALVVKPGVTYTGLGLDNEYTVRGSMIDFLWIEGRFSANGGFGGLRFDNARYAVLRHVHAFGTEQSESGNRFTLSMVNAEHSLLEGIRLWNNRFGLHIDNDSNSGWITARDVHVVNSQRYGVFTSGVRHSVFEDIRVFNSGLDSTNDGPGIREQFAVNNVWARVVSASNGGEGMRMLDAAGCLYAGVTTANNNGNGFAIESETFDANPSDDNIVIGLTSVNNSSRGMLLHNARTTHIENTTILNNAVAGIELSEGTVLASTSNTFTGALNLGGNGVDCIVSANSGDLGDDGVGVTNCQPGAAPLAITTAIDVTNPQVFAGKVTMDNVNASDINGERAFDEISDWINFAFPHRGWGKHGSAFPNADNRGPCEPGDQCHLWDFSLAIGNHVNIAAAAVPTGDDLITWAHGLGQGGTIILASSYEIVGDYRGNDDGRCESGEACWYLPNIGGYQGHQFLTDEPFVSGTLIDIELVRFFSNGFFL